jgi:hypothetical protein
MRKQTLWEGIGGRSKRHCSIADLTLAIRFELGKALGLYPAPLNAL